MASNGLITDLYQLTMANALFKKGMHERKVVFDRFYRKNPFGHQRKTLYQSEFNKENPTGRHFAACGIFHSTNMCVFYALMKLPAHLPYGLQLHSPSVQLSSFLMDVLDSYP